MKLKNRIAATGITIAVAAGVALIGAPAANAAEAQIDNYGAVNYPFAPSDDTSVGQAGIGWVRLADGTLGQESEQTFGSAAKVTLDDNVDVVQVGEKVRITVTATNRSSFARLISTAIPTASGLTVTGAESSLGEPIVSSSHVFASFGELEPGETGTAVITAQVGDVAPGTTLQSRAYVYQDLSGPMSQITDTNTVIG
ncbi:hypothetical protein [Microbacterium maritypicum]